MSMKIQQIIPQGKYLSAIRHRDLVYTSGMTPRESGKLIYSGKIKANDSLHLHKEAIQLATSNALSAAQSCLHEGERLSTILQLNVFLNAEKEFLAHAKLADYASEFLIKYLGVNCIGSRVAIGVESLPSNAPVEISITATVV